MRAEGILPFVQGDKFSFSSWRLDLGETVRKQSLASFLAWVRRWLENFVRSCRPRLFRAFEVDLKLACCQ